MDEDVITGRLNLTEADLRDPIIEMSFWLRFRWGYVAIIAILVGLQLASGAPLTTEWLPGLACVSTFMAVLFFAPWYSARRIRAALVRAGDDEVIYRFDRDGVTVRTSGSTASFAYRTLSKVKEGTTAFLLYTNPVVAQIVPKRAFAADDVDRVRALMSSQAKPEPIRVFPWKRLLLWVALVVAFLVLWQVMNARPPR